MATWYYEHRGEQRGPVTEEELHALLRAGTVTRDTNVWTDGMADWQPAGHVLDVPAPTPATPPPMPPGATGFAAPGGYGAPTGGQGAVPPGGGTGPAHTERVENHLIKAILVTVFCCLPVGIVAIVYAAQVDGKARAGDVAEARRLSDEAAKWSKWALFAGIAAWVLYVLFYVMAFATAGGY